MPPCTNPDLGGAVAAYEGNAAVLKELKDKGLKIRTEFLSASAILGLGVLVRTCMADGRIRPSTATASFDPTPRLRGNVPKTIFQHFFCRKCRVVVRPDKKKCRCGAKWQWDEAVPS